MSTKTIVAANFENNNDSIVAASVTHKDSTMKLLMHLLLIVLLALVTSSFGDEVLQLIDEPCQNYEETSAALQEAKTVWAAPDCYKFTYTFTGFQIGEPEPQNVQVRNGVAEDREKTMDDFFGMVETSCVAGCPTEGAARCEIAYGVEGYPMSIFIDMNKYFPDDRRAFLIENFAVVDCDGQEEPTAVPSTPVEQPRESSAPSPVAPIDEPTLSPTPGASVGDTTTNSPTQMISVDDTASASPTQATTVDDTATISPTQMISVDGTTTSSPTQTSNTTDPASRSTIVLNGFSLSLSTDEENALDEEALSAVMTQYLRDELKTLEGFLDVRLISMDEDVTSQAGRQAQPYESRMFSGEAFFAGEAPEESAVLEVQDAALTDNTRVQKALDNGGVNADVIKTEIFEKETVGTENNTPSKAQAVPYTFWFSFVAAVASLLAVV